MSYHYTNTNSYSGLGHYYGFGGKEEKEKKSKVGAGFQTFLQNVTNIPRLPKFAAKLPAPRPMPVRDAAPELRPSDVLPISVASKAKAAAVAMDEDMMAPGFMPPGLMKMPPGLMKMPPGLEPAETGASEPAPAETPPTTTEAMPIPKVIPMAPGYMMPGMLPPPPMRPGMIAPPPKPIITPQQARLGTIAAALGAGLLFF